MKKRTITDIAAAKGATPLAVLTCYSAVMARLLDPLVDITLVGDSLGMVIYGMESTLGVTLDMMIAHGKAVAKNCVQAFVVVDLPFGSYQQSKEQAFATAARVMAETGAQGVKLEGGIEMAETVAFLTARGIPVMGHVGLMPQSVHTLGGYRYQGRSDAQAKLIMNDAQAIALAGAFAIVLEAVREDIARDITQALRVPTIGIGASPHCDGQVLVVDDMLGLTERIPGFVKRYAELGDHISQAVSQYAQEIRAHQFPGKEHCYPFPKK